jgi:hypothetical protein
MRQITCYLAIVLFSQMAIADDWPQWQGPNRNAVSGETGLLQEWPEGGHGWHGESKGLVVATVRQQ